MQMKVDVLVWWDIARLSLNDDVLLCDELGNADEGRCVGLVGDITRLSLNDDVPLCDELGNVDEGVDVGLVPLHVLVLYQPLDLLLDELFAWEEHVLQNVHQFSL